MNTSFLRTAFPLSMTACSAASLYVNATSTYPSDRNCRLCVVSPKYHSTCNAHDAQCDTLHRMYHRHTLNGWSPLLTLH